jgi:hypothetical protein
MIAFKDKNDGYYQYDWDGVSALPEWAKGMTQIDVVVPTPVLPTYQELRAAAYPSASDYLDGVVKGDQAQIDAYIAACLAVKAKYPK